MKWNDISTHLANDVGDDPTATLPPSSWAFPPLLFLLCLPFLFKRLWRLPLRIFCKERRTKVRGRESGYISLISLGPRRPSVKGKFTFDVSIEGEGVGKSPNLTDEHAV